MKASIEWLREYVDLEASTNELVDVFPMLGMEVEGVEDSGPPPLDNVVVGEVISRDQHPEADRLSCCNVPLIYFAQNTKVYANKLFPHLH